MRKLLIFILLVILFHYACNHGNENMKIINLKKDLIAINTNFIAKKKLSDYGMFAQPLKSMKLINNLVFSYDLNSELFSDYALKKRFIYLPKGSAMIYDSLNAFQFPDEALIFKFFFYPYDMKKPNENIRIIETRVLYKQAGTWQAYSYMWDSLQQDAYLEIAGEQTEVSWLDYEGKKNQIKCSIPNMIQCKSCHDYDGKIVPIGPAARHINKISFVNNETGIYQIENWVKSGKLKGTPDLEKIPVLENYHNGKFTVNQRAKSYLDINCAHCHNNHGSARNSALNLRYDETNEISFGVYKRPIAAGNGSGGLKYDIVPGKPEESILYYRMNSNAPGVAMPELSRNMIHKEGLDLIKNWIESLD